MFLIDICAALYILSKGIPTPSCRYSGVSMSHLWFHEIVHGYTICALEG